MSPVPREEPSLDFRPSFVPKIVNEFLCHLSSTPNPCNRMSLLQEFLTRLELELVKIQAFKRELPLCMFLLNDAISALNEELAKIRTFKSEPVLEEFIPLKTLKREYEEKEDSEKEEKYRDKNDWVSSFQLWNTEDEAHCNRNNAYRSEQKQKKSKEEERQSMEKDYFQHGRNRNVERGFAMPLSTYLSTEEEGVVDGLSLRTPATAVKNTREGRGSRISSCRVVSSATSPLLLPQSGRKQRRCWSPELHHRFVKALEELGGSQATPKQIRELMRVDGLTNDEVKSHLQKYRLHTRRAPAATAANSSNSGADLGGLWMHKEALKGTSSCSPQGPLQFATQSGEATSTTEDKIRGVSHLLKNNT
ncbi:myb family transcription factor EFM-like isoform X2 [Vigna unguiculata]|uniref:myb family transcription factor EFM-like isoform X2 n=1 Tax=Vigna unguiculata TaxID=3917 RepID=UPI001016E683|nr:myb family transcription factor EFM-like isoform X2 [Vigna unguiculata]